MFGLRDIWKETRLINRLDEGNEKDFNRMLRFGFEEYEDNVFAIKLPEMTHEQCQESLNASSSPLVEVTEPITLNGIDELVEWLEE